MTISLGIEVFDINSLIHFFALTSFSIQFENQEMDSISRIVFLLQKVNNSKGIKNVVLNMGTASLYIKKESVDILSNIRSEYPEYFMRSVKDDKCEENKSEFYKIYCD